MALTKVHLLPLFVSIFLPGTFITTYIISILLKHVEPDLPYISDTGSQSPESCIFAQMLNICCALIALTMYFRYKQVEQHYRDHLSSSLNRGLQINIAAFFSGLLSVFGLSLVANFQQSNAFVVHMVGFFMTSVGATLYIWLQTVATYYGHPLMNSLRLARVRLALAFLATAAFIITIAAGLIAIPRVKPHANDWRPGEKNFWIHILSAASEWVMVFVLDFFLLSFAIDFKNISVSSPKVYFAPEEVDIAAGDMYQSEDRLSETHSINPGSYGFPATFN